MTHFNSVPTVDLQPLWSDDGEAGIKNVAEQLKEKLAPTGFVYIINHQIPEELVDKIFKASARFHALPLETKMKIKQNEFFRGYLPNKTSQIKLSTEGIATKPNKFTSFSTSFEVPETHPDYAEGLYLAGPNQWPENLPGFKEVVCEYRAAMLKLCHRLVKAFSVALGMEPNGLDKLFIEPSFYYWLHYYPEEEGEIPEGQFGIAPHTDFGFITILAQDAVGGLEVKLSDGQWVDAPYVPNTFVLNAGNLLKKISNDLFRAVPHRVINRSNKPRYSIPFFFDPNMYSIVEVLESCITPENPAKYAPVMYGDDFVDRIKSNYGVGKRRT